MLEQWEVVGCVHIVQDSNLLPDSFSFESTQSQLRFCGCGCFFGLLLNPLDMGRRENESSFDRGLQQTTNNDSEVG